MVIEFYQPRFLNVQCPLVSISPADTRIRLNRLATQLWVTNFDTRRLMLGYNKQAKRVYIKPAKKEQGLSLVFCKGSNRGSSSISFEGFLRQVVKKYPSHSVQVPVKLQKGMLIFSIKEVV